MKKPSIHLNGTSGERLAMYYEQAAEAVFRAQEALMLACPNGRDYYPQGEDAYSDAHAEHNARQKKLLEVYDELEALASHVRNEMGKRKRGRP